MKIRNIAKTLSIYLLRIFMTVLYAPLKLLPTKNSKILFLSRQSDEVNLDFKLLQDFIKKEKPDAEIVNICKRCDSGFRDYIVFVWYITKSLYHIATSRVCVLDTYWPSISMLRHKEELFVIQLWHAMGKIKKSGYQSLGKIGGRDARVAKAMAMHRNYDAVIAGGQAWNPFYCQSFGVEERVLVNCGLPRTDYLIESEKSNREKIIKAYPQFEEKKVLLYAPTFRRGWKAHWEALLKHIDFEKYILIVKSHPNQKLQTSSAVYTCKEFSAVELLSVCDYLITDYSAIAVEGAILNRKTLYYVYDYEEYDKNNGLNINLFDIMPDCVFRDAKELATALEREYPQQLLDSYKQKYLPSPLGVSTETIGKLIIEKTEK